MDVPTLVNVKCVAVSVAMIEVRMSRHHDLMSALGLLICFQIIRRIRVSCPYRGVKPGRSHYARHASNLKPCAKYLFPTCKVGGHLWCGAPCSSFVWISRGSTRRCRLRPGGSKRIASVRAANKLVRRFCYACLALHLLYSCSFPETS